MKQYFHFAFVALIAGMTSHSGFLLAAEIPGPKLNCRIAHGKEAKYLTVEQYTAYADKNSALVSAIRSAAKALSARHGTQVTEAQSALIEKYFFEALRRVDPSLVGKTVAALIHWPDSYQAFLLEQFVSYSPQDGIRPRHAEESSGSISRRLRATLSTPSELVLFLDRYGKGERDGDAFIDLTLSVARIDSSHLYHSPWNIGPQSAQNLAIALLGKSALENPKIVPLLRQLELKGRTQYAAEYALLARGQAPRSYDHIIMNLRHGSARILRELISIHSRNQLVHLDGFSELHAALKESAAEGGKVDQILVRFLREADHLGNRRAELQFIQDLGLMGPHLREHLKKSAETRLNDPAMRPILSETSPEAALSKSLERLANSPLKEEYGVAAVTESLRLFLSKGLKIPDNYMIRVYIRFPEWNRTRSLTSRPTLNFSDPDIVRQANRPNEIAVGVPFAKLHLVLNELSRKEVAENIEAVRIHDLQQDRATPAPAAERAKFVTVGNQNIDRAIFLANTELIGLAPGSRTYLRKGSALSVPTEIRVSHPYGEKFDHYVEAGTAQLVSQILRLNLGDREVTDEYGNTKYLPAAPFRTIHHMNIKVTEFLTNGDVPVSMRVRLIAHGNTGTASPLDPMSAQIFDALITFDLSNLKLMPTYITDISTSKTE